MADLAGQTIGQYQIMERLGRGGMADVYRAFHPGLAVYRAVKVIRPEFVSEADFKERFQQEARAVAAMRHPSIVQMHDFGVQGDLYYMVMEYLEGQDLKHIIAQRAPFRPFSDIIPIVEQVSSALTYAHQRGVIHRDIKPANVMMTSGGQVILMDFGIARMVATKERLTHTGTGLGTPAYMAPEQAQAQPEIGPSADIYSLGVTIYEMLTGRVPFDADTPLAILLKVINDPLPQPRQICPEIPEAVETVILKATTRDPALRYDTANELADDLKRSLDGEAPLVTVPRPTAATQMAGKSTGSSQSRRRWLLPGVIIGLVGLLALVLVVGSAMAGILFLIRSQLPSSSQGTIQIDQTVSGALGSPDESATYRLAATAGETYFFDYLNLTASVNLKLLTPDGFTEVFNYSAYDAASGESGTPITLDQTGTYVFTIEPTAEDGVEFTFVVRQIDPAVIEGGQLPFDQLANSATTLPGQTATYLFDVTAGQTVFFDMRNLTDEADLKLLAPDGFTEVFNQYAYSVDGADAGPLTLDQDGTYIFTIDPRADATLEYAFIVHDIDPVVINGGELSFDELVRGSTTIPGQVASYTFEAEAGDVILIDYQLLNAPDGVELIILAPDGFTEVINETAYNADSDDTDVITLEQSGIYTLTIDPRVDSTVEFAVVVQKQ